MCDTILAPPDSTAKHVMLFGKNSDRQRNEAQTVEYFPSVDHSPETQTHCQYLTIPQVRHTYAMLLCRPFWIWGGEMGANEHGVAIGNEAVHARVPADEQPALTGNDLIRLALERAESAARAVEIMAELLERYGQGGNCGHLTPNYYNNGFMIADAAEAYVMETLGREWVVERVHSVRTMSNRYSIGSAVHLVSAGLVPLIRNSGWSDEPQPCYEEALANPHREHIGNAGARRACSTSLLRARDGRVDVSDMMRILRDHGTGDRHHPEWHSDCTFTRTVCMHAGTDDRPGHTAGSMVSELNPASAVHWVTGTAIPCISIFKPVFLDTRLPEHGPRPSDRFDLGSLWWRHERLHRAILGNFGRFLDGIRAERDALESDFRTRVQTVMSGGSQDDRSRVIADCWQDAIEMEDRWFARIDGVAALEKGAYAAAWEEMNTIAAMDFAGKSIVERPTVMHE